MILLLFRQDNGMGKYMLEHLYEGECEYNENWIFCSDRSGNNAKKGKLIYYNNVSNNRKLEEI